MEKFIKCLIWLQFIPVTQNKNNGYWQFSKLNLKFLLLMAVIIFSIAFYSIFVLWQAFSSKESASLADWCMLIYKISLMSGSMGYPVMMGITASALETRACHPQLQIPLPSLAYLIFLITLFIMGVVGIHYEELTRDLACAAPLGVAISILFCTFVSTTLVAFTWIYDLINDCPDAEEQELIEATETNAFLHKYECLKSGKEFMLMIMFSYVQILLVFSLYNSLQGWYKCEF
jgi:hypothetical protein